MYCDEVKKLIDEYISLELDEKDRIQVEKHLRSCDGCRAEYEELKGLKSELRALNEDVPKDFEQKLTEKIKKEQRISYFDVKKFAVSAAAVVVLVCAVKLGYGTGNVGLPDNTDYAIDTVIEKTTIAYAEKGKGVPKAQTEPTTENIEITQAEKAVIKATESTTIKPVERIVHTESATETVTMADKAKAIPFRTVEVTINETTTEVQLAPAMVSEESTSDIAPITEENSIPVLKSAGYVEEFDVNLTVDISDATVLEEELKKIDEISEIDTTDEVITAKVTGVNYSELLEKLNAFEITEDEVNTEPDDKEYNVKFNLRKH